MELPGQIWKHKNDLFYNFICILFVERENDLFRVLILFRSSLFQSVLFVHILVKCNCYAYDDNDMIKYLITLLQKWDVTGTLGLHCISLQELVISRVEQARQGFFLFSPCSSRSTIVARNSIDIYREKQDVGVLNPHQKALNLGISLCLP